MPLTERSRAVLYSRLTTVIADEEAVGEMLTQLTAVEAEQVATKDFVRAEIHAATIRLVMWMVTLSAAQMGVLLSVLR